MSRIGEQTPKIDPETIKNGVGNWVLFFCKVEGGEALGWGDGWGKPGLREQGSRTFSEVQITVFGALGGGSMGGGSANS